MLTFPPERNMYYILRIAVAMCFIGHGAFGIITKQIWCNYFGVFGIGTGLSYSLMPIVGIVDILMGLIVLAYPIRFFVAWLVFWGLFTATLRPLAGEPFAELIERAGNFGAPLALLILTGARLNTVKMAFLPILPSFPPTGRRTRAAVTCLRITVFLLLAGHGWLNLLEKAGLMEHYSRLGFSEPASIARFAGIFELSAAFAILIRPVRPVIIAVLVWKIATEMLYPHYMVFEWIERGGSYGSILALYVALSAQSSSSGLNRGTVFKYS